MSTSKCSRSGETWSFQLHKLTVHTEISRGAKSLVRMDGNQTILDPPETAGNKDAEPGSRSGRATEKKPQIFSFGTCAVERTELLLRAVGRQILLECWAARCTWVCESAHAV